MSLSTDKTTKKILPRLGSAGNSHKNQRSRNGQKERDRVKGSSSKRLKENGKLFQSSVTTFMFSYADPTRSSKERKLSELRIWPSFMDNPLPKPPRMLVVFSAVVLNTDSVFWNLWKEENDKYSFYAELVLSRQGRVVRGHRCFCTGLG